MSYFPCSNYLNAHRSTKLIFRLDKFNALLAECSTNQSWFWYMSIWKRIQYSFTTSNRSS